MKFNFEFIINKEAAFFYWIQTISKWSFDNEVNEANFYLISISSLNNQEKELLTGVKSFISKRGYQWLWERYSGKPIEDEQEIIFWDNVRSVFNDKFNDFWNKELKFLESWRDKLINENFDFSDLFQRFSTFIGISDKFLNTKRIKVLLLFYHNANFAAGHSFKGFDDFILLNISHVKKDSIESVLGVLVHEVLHILERKSSTLSNLLKKSYEKIIVPQGFRSRNPSWRYKLTETVVNSVASRRYNNYLGIVIFHKKPEIIDFPKEIDANNYGFQIRLVSSMIVDKTIDYLKNNKVVDSSYCDFVAESWLSLYKLIK